MRRRARFFRMMMPFVSELLLVLLALFAMDGLAHLRFEPRQFAILVVAWAVVFGIARGLRARSNFPRWSVVLGEMVLPVFVLNELGTWGRGDLNAAQILYALALVAVLVGGWRRFLAGVDARGIDRAGESARLMIVGATAVAAMLPLFNDRLVGGTDARWYSYMLGDFIAQLRDGVFPVFVGQGELAWNGGVHPFRTAPAFMHVAGLGDALTFHALNVCALQHLAAIVAALVGGLGMYAAGVALVPQRRWESAGVALLYLGAPVSLQALYHADAYMSWMALAVLPLVFFGNARAVFAADGQGYVALAAGLAGVWMCHPPLALLATMATVLLQGGSLLCGEVTAGRLRGAALGALWFAGLSAFYFFGMSELPPSDRLAAREDAFQLGGLALWLAGLGGAVLRRRGLGWLILLAPGGWLLWLSRTPWLWWMLATTCVVTLVVWLARWRRWFDPSRHAFEVLFPSALLAAALIQAWLGPANPARDVARLADLNLNAMHAAHFFLPLSPLVNQPGDWQPGLGLWCVLAALGVSFFRPGPLAVKVWFAVGLLPVFAIVRVPLLSEFLVGYAPRWFASVAGATFTLRLMPTAAALLAMGWLVWLAACPLNRGTRALSCGLLLAASMWAVHEAAGIVRHGFAATATRTTTENHFRPENVVLDRFAYDLLPLPSYFSHGKIDPRLEVRALDETKRVRIDPDITALRMEEAGRSELHLICLPYEPPAAEWLRLGPSLTLKPGEHVLLRFEFNSTKNYTGYLFLQSGQGRGYREYALPDSGARHAFGSAPDSSHVISLWNSGVVPERYEFSFRRGAGCTLPLDGSPFATVFISHHDAARSLVRVDSLLPYRATAAMSWPGFVETSRVWLPGYVAKVDGQPAAVVASPEGLAMVPLLPGLHTVELRFTGTKALWTTWWISAGTWSGLLGFVAWQLKKKS